LPLPILYAFTNPQTKSTITDCLSKQRVSDEDAEKIVDIVYEDENVETFRNEVNQMAEKAFNNIKNIPNKNFLSLIEILKKGILEDV
jgi:geranylgeranyl pyrophosphate synthase